MNYHHLASWYITRYAPSHARVTAYLHKKKCPNVPQILTDLEYDETMMIRMWVQTFLNQKIGRKIAENKLYKKEFPRDLIAQTMDEYGGEFSDWLLYKDTLHEKVKQGLAKGKSIRYIAQELSAKYPYFRTEITELLSTFHNNDALEKAAQKYQTKYNPVIPEERQKLYQALMRRGFSYSDITSYFQ